MAARRQSARRAGRSISSETSRPPTSAQKAEPIPRTVSGEAAMARAKNAPIGRSVTTLLRSASMSALKMARPARLATRLSGRTPSSVPAVLAHKASTKA